jgi:hypothetical protein
VEESGRGLISGTIRGEVWKTTNISATVVTVPSGFELGTSQVRSTNSRTKFLRTK